MEERPRQPRPQASGPVVAERGSSPRDERESPPRDARGLAIVLALLSALPFLVARYPQLTDYPSHLARYHVMLDIGHNPWLAHYYRFAWIWTGNLGADLLMVPLGHLLGVETAGWLVGMIIAPLTGLGLIAVEWVLRRRIGVASLLALTLIWSPAMGMGFYNFCLSLALALFAFAGWVQLEGWRWRWLVYLPIGFLVWLCHASGWGVLGVLVFGYEWHRRKHLATLIAPWPLFGPMVAMALDPGPSAGALPYGPDVWGYKYAIVMQAMRDQSVGLDLATLGLLVLALLVATALRRIDGRLGWAALLLALMVVVVPRHLGGGDYADFRLIPVALMIGCLAIAWPAPRWALMIAPALFLARLDYTASAWHANSRLLTADLKALDYIPEGARVAGAVLVERASWKLNPFEHAPSYATVRRDALVNSHFAIPGVHMLSLREAIPGFVDPSQRILADRGEPIRLDLFEPVLHADYLWYFGRRMPAGLPAGARMLYRTRHSFLARLAKTPVAR